MRPTTLNLARRPFVNRRPVIRSSIALWALALLVILADVSLYVHYAVGSRDRRQALNAAQGRVSQERQALRDLEQAPEFGDLKEYNTRIDYLNQLITARTFPWGRLFDRLGEVMPAGVRFRRLTPQIEAPGQAEGGAPAEAGPVRLQLDGVARSDGALYRFVDALFAAPDFDNPILKREAQGGAGQSFSISVTYLTSATGPSRAPDRTSRAKKKRARSSGAGT
jgi:Tfp pilus assembly protein PilN